MGNMGAGAGVLGVETIPEIRRAYFAQKKPITASRRAVVGVQGVVPRRQATVPLGGGIVGLSTARLLCAGFFRRETKDVVSAAQTRPFAFSRGPCTGGSSNNIKPAVETFFIARARRFNRR